MASRFGAIPLEEEETQTTGSRFGATAIEEQPQPEPEPTLAPEEAASAEDTFTKKMQEYGKKLAYDLGITARWGTEGTARAIGAITDPFGQMMASATGREYQPLEEYTSEKLTQLGLPEEVERYKKPGEIMRTVTGAAVPMGVAGQVAKGAPGLTQQVSRVMASQPTAQLTGATTGAVAREEAKEAEVGPVGQAAAEIVGGIVGGGAASMKDIPSQLPQAAQEAEKLGVRVLTSDIIKPESKATKWFQTISEYIPFAGTARPRKLQYKERANAIRNVMREYGADDKTLSASDAVMADLAKKRGKMLDIFIKKKANVLGNVDEFGSVPVNRATTKIDQEIEKIKAFNPESPLINVFEKFKNDIQNKSIINLDELRKDLGDMLSDTPELAGVKTRGEKVARRIYGPLKEDMGEFIREKGGQQSYNKWMVAEKKLAKMNDEMRMNVLQSTLKKGDLSPELVQRMIFSKKPSEMKMLYKNLSPEGKQNARIAVLQKAIKESGGMEEINPQKFLTQLKKSGDQIGIYFKGQDLQQMKGLERALEITKRAGEAPVLTKTGMQNVPIVGSAVLTQYFGGLAPAAATAATLGLTARALESRPVRNILLKLPTLKKGSPEEAALAKRLFVLLQNKYDEANKKEEPQK